MFMGSTVKITWYKGILKMWFARFQLVLLFCSVEFGRRVGVFCYLFPGVVTAGIVKYPHGCGEIAAYD